VTLSPLTVFVGPNGAGKSTFFEALTLLAGTTRFDFHKDTFWKGLDAFQYRSAFGPDDGEIDIDVDFTMADQGAVHHYSLGLMPGAPLWDTKVSRELYSIDGQTAAERDTDGRLRIPGDEQAEQRLDGHRAAPLFYQDPGRGRIPEAFLPTRDYLKGVHHFDFRPERIQEVNELTITDPTELEPDGSNLTAVLHALRDTAPEKFESIQDDLRRFEPACSKILFESSTGLRDNVQIPLRRLAYRMDAGTRMVTLPACSVSAGLRLFTAYLTLRHLAGGLSVLLVEEPETGVHPGRLREIVDCLRTLTQGPRATQVVLTTHSPYLLDMCAKEEIVVFYPDKDGSCTARPFEHIRDVDRLLETFDVGELWASAPERDLFEAGRK